MNQNTEKLKTLLESTNDPAEVITAIDELLIESESKLQEADAQLTKQSDMAENYKQVALRALTRDRAVNTALLESLVRENEALRNERDTLQEHLESAVIKIKAEYADSIESSRQQKGVGRLVESFITAYGQVNPLFSNETVTEYEQSIKAMNDRLTESQDLARGYQEKIDQLTKELNTSKTNALIESKIGHLSTIKRAKARRLVSRSGLVEWSEIDTFLTEALKNLQERDDDQSALVESHDESTPRHKTVKSDDKFVQMLIDSAK